MSVGTNLLVQIFETFDTRNTSQKIFRRLFCESGQAARKSHMFANDSTKSKLEQIIPKCRDCKHQKLKTSTIVLVFEELAKLQEPELLKETYIQIGGPSKRAYAVCNKKTQHVIQRLELQKEQKASR